jgi:hypothetical protein
MKFRAEWYLILTVLNSTGKGPILASLFLFPIEKKAFNARFITGNITIL